MKVTRYMLFFISLFLIQIGAQAQKRVELTCETIEKILLYATDDFGDLLGDFESKLQDCNYYHTKEPVGIDSTSTLQSCAGDEGHLVLHFDTYIGNDEIHSDVEFKTLEGVMDRCLTNFKKKEVKPVDFKRIIRYTNADKLEITIFQDLVKPSKKMTPMVTVVVMNEKRKK